MKRNKIFNSLIATAAFTGILTAGFPKVALSATNILNVCKESNSSDSDYIVYLESQDGTLRITTPKDSNGFNRQTVKETLKTDYEYTESEADTVASNLVPYDKITGNPICYTSSSSSSSNGVQGIELRYLDSAVQCGSDTRQANIKVDVYDRRDYTKLATLSKEDTKDTYTTSDIDSINDLDFVYKIYDFTHCGGFTQGMKRNATGSMVLGSSDTIPDIAGFEDQTSVSQMLEGLDSYEKLLLVELGSGNTSSSDYDLQDVVLVVDNNPESLLANTAPIAKSYNVQTLVNEPITIDVVADAIDADNDTLTISEISQPTGGTATDENGAITFRSLTTGTYTFTYTISDGTDTSTGNVTVLVLGYAD